MTAGPETQRRRVLADRITRALLVEVEPRAVLLVGSVASGEADALSDLDLISYYDELPSDESVERARSRAGAGASEPLGGDRREGAFAETWHLDGVECQIAFRTIATQEHDLDRILRQHDPATVLHKAMSGLMEGVALSGPELIEAWQRRAVAYPDELAEAVVRHHLRFFPLWYVGERLARSDALLWHHRARIEILQNVLGVLAGLNRSYYSTFQFKRMRRFIGAMTKVPADLADRVERALTADPATAGDLLESLVTDVVVLVEQHMPTVETSEARRYFGRRQVMSADGDLNA